MMDILGTLRGTVNDAYGNSYRGTTSSREDFFCNLYFVADFTQNNIEVPVGLINGRWTETIGFLRNGGNKVIIPYLTSTKNFKVIATCLTGIVLGLERCRGLDSCRIVKITLKDGRIFYAGDGIILDKDMNVLFILLDRLVPTGNHEFHLTETVAVVHSRVFTDRDDSLCKAIASKIVPELLKVERSLPYTSGLSHNVHNVTVEIRDTKGIVQKSTTPTPSTFSNESINAVLNEFIS